MKKQISFYCIFRKYPNFYGNRVCINAISGFVSKVNTLVAVRGQRANFPTFFPSLSTRLKAG